MIYNNVLLDTNVCLDVMLNRQPFAVKAGEIIDRTESGEITGSIAAHSFDTLFYIIEKKSGRKKAPWCSDTSLRF